MSSSAVWSVVSSFFSSGWGARVLSESVDSSRKGANGILRSSVGVLKLALRCQPSLPKLPLLMSPIVGALDVACAVAAMKPSGGSDRMTASLTEPETDDILCATLPALRLPVVGVVGVVGEVGEAIAAIASAWRFFKDIWPSMHLQSYVIIIRALSAFKH